MPFPRSGSSQRSHWSFTPKSWSSIRICFIAQRNICTASHQILKDVPGLDFPIQSRVLRAKGDVCDTPVNCSASCVKEAGLAPRKRIKSILISRGCVSLCGAAANSTFLTQTQPESACLSGMCSCQPKKHMLMTQCPLLSISQPCPSLSILLLPG